MIYLVCFAASSVLAYFANKTKERKYFWLFSVLSILLPVLLAGLRDYSVGIDVKNYYRMERYWNGAINAESLGEYLHYYISKGYREPLFALFIGMIAQLTGQYRVFLFLSHVIIMVGVYVGAFRMKHRARPDLVLLMFYLLYFNNSLNIIRQYIAVAIIFSVFADLEQRNFVRYTVVVFVASLIHSSALMAFVPLCLYVFLYPKKEIEKAQDMRFIIAVALIIIGTLAFIPTVKLFMKVGILPKKYGFFLKNATGRMALTRAGLLVLEMAGVALCFNNLKEKVPRIAFYLAHTVMFMCFEFLAPNIVDGHRIVLYFVFTNIIMLLTLPRMLQTEMLQSLQKLPMLPTKKLQKLQKWLLLQAEKLQTLPLLQTEKLQTIGYVVIFAFVLYFWYYLYVRAVSSGTYPYLFCF